MNSLEESMKDLASFLIERAKDSSESIKKYNDENLKGFYEGRADAFRLASEFLLKRIEYLKK